MRLAASVAILSFTLLAQNRGAFDEAPPSGIVERFAKFDFEGYRLDSEGHKAIWDLTIDDGSPAVFPMYLIKTYSTGPAQRVPGGSIRIPVTYQIIGVIQEGPKGLSFRLKPALSTEVFPVKCEGAACKIDLDRAVFHVSAHVGREAVLAWIKALEGIQNTEREKEPYKQLFDQVTNAK